MLTFKKKQTLHWFFEEFICFRQHIFVCGWVFDEKHDIEEIGITINKKYYKLNSQLHLSSPDVAQAHGERAHNSRFSGFGRIAKAEQLSQIIFTVTLSNRKKIHIKEAYKHSLTISDHYHKLQADFFDGLHTLKPDCTVLEIGSRARSGVTRKDQIPKHLNYVGFDILKGKNVDILGDAHELSQYFEPESCSAIFSLSVFEHLIMPWKVVLEVNKVLKLGGTIMVATHHTWPLHETPWDFWRFSDQGWHALFNRYTGFEILETALGEPASIVPHYSHDVVFGLENQPAYLVSVIVAKKIDNTELKWDVDAREITQDMYPE